MHVTGSVYSEIKINNSQSQQSNSPTTVQQYQYSQL